MNTLESNNAAATRFTETRVWGSFGGGWQPLCGEFRKLGFSVEWHDFFADKEFEWADSFHPEAVELCLNVEGHGFVGEPGGRLDFQPGAAGFYCRRNEAVPGRRAGRQRHQFLTVEYSRGFLVKQLGAVKRSLHPGVRAVLDRQGSEALVGAKEPLTAAQHGLIASLRQPPVCAAAQPLWYQCKALELAMTFLMRPEPGADLFCSRQERLAQERAEQVIFLLTQNLADPLSLEELGRKIGCSHFYLSRIFSARMGQTIPQYLRKLRMERAAQLLRGRELNVTEAALEVGYSSLSHFSAAFHQMFGCCPGLYPLKTASQADA